MLKTIWSIINREIKLIVKDKNITSVLLLAPIFYAFFYGSIYINKTENSIPIVIVDMDHSSFSQKLIRMLDAHQLINVENVTSDYSFGKEFVEKTDAQGMIFIPKSFEADIKNGRGTNVKLYLNTTRFLISNDINKAVNETIGTMNGGIRLKYFETQGYSFDQAKEMIEPVRMDLRSMFNYTDGYGDFLIPAVMILILHQTLMIGLSESIAKEREENSIYELFEKAGRNTTKALIGKGSFYIILYSVYALFFFSVTFSIFKVSFIGNALAFALATLLMVVAVTFLSIFISSFFNRKILAMQFLTLLSYPIFLISGYSWPMDSMPKLLQLIAKCIPFTPYSTLTIRITQMGAGFSNTINLLIHLAILAIIFFTAAYFRMNYLFTKSKTQNNTR